MAMRFYLTLAVGLRAVSRMASLQGGPDALAPGPSHNLCHENTIDSGRRIVIPEAIRGLFRLKAGQAVDIRADEGGIRIDVGVTPVQLKQHGAGLVAVADEEIPVPTAEQVRETLKSTRR